MEWCKRGQDTPYTRKKETKLKQAALFSLTLLLPCSFVCNHWPKHCDFVIALSPFLASAPHVSSLAQTTGHFHTQEPTHTHTQTTYNTRKVMRLACSFLRLLLLIDLLLLALVLVSLFSSFPQSFLSSSSSPSSFSSFVSS